jgi:hypothetical protein
MPNGLSWINSIVLSSIAVFKHGSGLEWHGKLHGVHTDY